MNNQNTDARATDTIVDEVTAAEAAAQHGPRKAVKSMSVGTSTVRTKSKKDQLVALLSKQNGARITVLVERLGWQAHTVRAVLSGLRKQGIEIATTKSAKTGETIYVIATQPNGESGRTEGVAS